MRRKLQTIDKNTRHRDVAQGRSLFDQGDMSLMQVAHGWHESRTPIRTQVLAQVGNGVNDMHEKSLKPKRLKSEIEKCGVTKREGRPLENCLLSLL